MYSAMYITLVIMAIITGQVDSKVEDLTHNFGPSPPNWPSGPPYILTILFRGLSSGAWFELNKIETSEHTGTHLDAPSHFAEGKLRVHQIPMEKLIGPGVIINVTAKVTENPDYQVTMKDLKAWESEHGRIPEGAVVIMNSGWASKYPNRELTFGSATPNDTSTFHFPGWKESAVKWLIKKRYVNVVGVDTPSTDYGQSATFPVHQALGEEQVPGLENVANLDAIPEYGTTIYVAVTKIYDGSGGPARVFAIFEKEEGDGNGE